jgi:4-amino-4-deoxy-L-arabinose transferase-like glycosyltransferase
MLVHSRLISMNLADIPVTVGQGSSTAGRYMLLNGFVPQWEFLRHALLTNAGTWILLGIGICLALTGLRQAQSRRNALLLLLALPVLSVTFYTNAFPYAYLVLMPTACLLAGHAYFDVHDKRRAAETIVALACLGMAAMPMVPLAWEYRNDGQEHQKQIVTEVHRLFPKPVPTST